MAVDKQISLLHDRKDFQVTRITSINKDKGLMTDAVFIDSSKAFDYALCMSSIQTIDLRHQR